MKIYERGKIVFVVSLCIMLSVLILNVSAQTSSTIKTPGWQPLKKELGSADYIDAHGYACIPSGQRLRVENEAGPALTLSVYVGGNLVPGFPVMVPSNLGRDLRVGPAVGNDIADATPYATYKICYDFVGSVLIIEQVQRPRHPSDPGLGARFVETIAADVNADGKVDIMDMFQAAAAFGSVPGNPRWNYSVDINKDLVINIIDIFQIAARWGFVTPPDWWGWP